MIHEVRCLALASSCFFSSFFLNPLKSTIVDLNDVSESQKEIPEIRGKLQKLRVDIA